ncbi:MAG: hypothetical protein ABI365_00040, partial [Lysobacteraceae bacterium]
LLKDDASIRKEAFVANCIEMRKPTHGLWADHGQLILVAANPMLKGGVLQGVVLTATHLDADFATAIQRLTRTGIVLFVPAPTASGTSASNGLASWIAPALVAEAQQMIVATTTSGAALKLSDGQHDMAAWATPLDADGGHAVLVALDSGANGDATMHASTTQLLYGLLLSGIIGIVIVLLQWSRTYVPLQGMIDIIERAAQGDQHLTVPAAKGSPIVLYLRGVINRLLERQRK